MTASTPGVTLAVTVTLAPDWRDRILTELRRNQVGARTAEPGCLRFDICTVEEQPDCLMLIEDYTDEAALQAHRDSPHFKAWNAFLETLPEGVFQRARLTLRPIDGV